MRGGERLEVVDTVEKNMLATIEGFGPGQLSYFCQQFWMPHRTEFSRHRHPVMKEIILVVDGELEVVLQQTLKNPPVPHLLRPGEVIIAEPNVLHTLRNWSYNRVEGLAIGFILEPNGITIRE